MSSLFKAITLAVAYHGEQKDKRGELYVLHPLRVMNEFSDKTMRIAAVLHDTVEDTKLSLEMIEEFFGSDVSRIVDALSRRENERYEDFIGRCGDDICACQIKAMDIVDNLRPEREVPNTIRLRQRYFKSLVYLVEQLLANKEIGRSFVNEKRLVTYLYNNKYKVRGVNYNGFV